MRAPEKYLGRPVRSLQTMLRQLSDLDPRILPVIPDGYYGQSTYASVRSFQQAYGLRETGNADAVTWARIASEHSRILPTMQTPMVLPVWTPDTVILPGMRNHHLMIVQAMFAVLSDYFPTLTASVPSGQLDPTTETALRWLQRAAQLPDTGALDTPTWHYLTGLYRVMAGNGTK